MKNSVCLFAVAAMMCGMASCGSGSDEKLKLDYIPVQAREDAKWGFVGPDGKMLYEDEFKKTPSPVINGVFTVEEDGGISVYEATDKKPTLIKGLEELVDAGVMNDGVIPIVRKNERIKLVDKSGKEKLVLDPIDGNEIIRVSSCSENGLLKFVLANDHTGVMNTSGKVLIEPKYLAITYLYEDRYLALQYGEPDSLGVKPVNYYLLDEKGKEIVKFKDVMAPTTRFVDGKCLVMKSDDEIPGYINKSGEFTKLPAKIVKMDGYFDGKLFGFETEEGNCGIMNIDGEIVIRPKYRAIAPIPDGKYIVKNDNNQWFILNKDGEKETVLDYMEVMIPLSVQGYGGEFEMIGAEKKHRIDLYDYAGKAISQESFYNINLEIRSFVSSDYFNPEEIGRQLVSFIDADGVNGVKFDTPVSDILPKDAQARSFSDKYEYGFTDIPKGYNWTLAITGFTDKPIASPIYTTRTETYWFSTYTRQVLDGYKFNEDVNVKSFAISARSSRDFLEGALKAVSDALKEKGFKEHPAPEESVGDVSIFKRGNTEVIVNSYFEYDNELVLSVSDLSKSSDTTSEVEDSATVDSTAEGV